MRLLHLADLHLGFPLREDESKFNFFKSLDFVVEKAKEYKVEVVLIAGDVFHERSPNAKLQSIFSSFVRNLMVNKIPVLIITGNHEGPSFRGKNIHLDVYDNLKLPSVYVSKTSEVISINGANFITLPYPFKLNFIAKEENRNREESEVLNLMNRRLLDILDEKLSDIGNGNLNILVGHLPVSEGEVGFEKYINITSEIPLSIEELDRINISYFALGHLHKHQIIRSKKYGHVFVYPGSLDRLDFGDEDDEKGFYFVEVEPSKEPYLEFIKNPFAREFYTIEIQNEKSFESIDMEKVKRSITRLLIKGDLFEEHMLSKFIEIVKKEAYSFAYIDDRREGNIPIRDFVSKAVNPIESLIEYIDKSPNEDIKKLKNKIIEEAKSIFEEINEA